MLQLAEEDFADVQRIYLMGSSMGGYGTWQLAISMPEETLGGIVNQIQAERMMEKNLMNPQMLIEPELLSELLEGKAEEL